MHAETNKKAIGGILLFVLFLIVAYNDIVYPIINKTYHMIVDNLLQFFITPRINLFPLTTTIISQLVNYVTYLFNNPYAVAILIFISFLLILLEFKW